MRFAYADPPYLGMCKRYGHEHHGGGCWDDPQTHMLLISQLSEYDGWALSCNPRDLEVLLPWISGMPRIMAWCKTWSSWKPGVFPAYAWEPVILMSAGRTRKWKHGDSMTPRDWLACPAHQQGFFGSKPPEFVRWVLDCLGVTPEDEFVDLFPGSGAVTQEYERWRNQQRLIA